MPAIQSGPPEAGTYRFVLIRKDIEPRRAQRLVGYNETVQTRAIEWRGRTVQGAFVRSHEFAMRLRKAAFGMWADITQEWFASLGEDAKPVAKVPVRQVQPLTREQKIERLSVPARAMLMTLQASAHELSKQELIERSGIDVAEYNDEIATLLDDGLIVRNGVGRGVRFDVQREAA
jgi:predicted transcriptional regulator